MFYEKFGYQVKTDYDPFLGIKKISQVNNGGLRFDEPFIALNLVLTINDSGERQFWLEPYYYHTDWIFMKSIKIIADTLDYDFSILIDGRKTHVLSGGIVSEWCLIPIEKEVVNQLVNCNNLSARMYGSKFYRDVKYTSYIKSNWKNFYEQYLETP